MAYTDQVRSAEHKVLSIKRGVEFYYLNSKILIIYFIILIVKFYFIISNFYFIILIVLKILF